jgi:hypothetical protein
MTKTPRGLNKKEKDIVYKVWLEIERYNEETGEGEDVETLSLLPFAATAECATLGDAVACCKDLHRAVNPNRGV